MSEVPKVYGAILEVIKHLSAEGIGKNRMNAHQKYPFRGIDDVHNALSPALAAAGLVMLPRVTSRECVERKSNGGGTLFYTVLNVDFDLISTVDGSKHTVTVIGEAMDSADKSANKAMSAAYKYCAIQAFCIPVEGQADADAVTPEVKPRAEERKEARQEKQAAQPKSDEPWDAFADVFPKSWNLVKGWAGEPMGKAPPDVLSKFIASCNGTLERKSGDADVEARVLRLRKAAERHLDRVATIEQERVS
jgi:hypothetical protein